MQKKFKKLIEKHKETFPRAVINGVILTLEGYGLGVLLVDILGMRYYIAGILLTPITFVTKYIIDKYWVFKNE